MAIDQHISEDESISFLCGELQPEAYERLQQHFDFCQACTDNFQIYKHIYDGLSVIFQKQGKQLSPAQMHSLLIDEAAKERVYYSRLHFPEFFPIAIAKTHLGIAKIVLGEINLFKLDELLQQLFPGKLLVHSDIKLRKSYFQLKEYFAGERQSFDLKLDKSLMKGEFQRTVLGALMHFKFGQCTTYGELAKRIHKPGASRAVGNALGRNPLPIIIPCHRVLAGKGQLGGFTGGTDIKKQLLMLEKIDHASLDLQMSLF